MVLPQLKDLNFQGKKVLVRCDLDVPLREQQSSKAAKQQRREVADDTKIRECLPTIKYLLGNEAEVILMGHLGRPEGMVVEELRLTTVAQKLGELLSSKFKVQSPVPGGTGQSSKLSPPLTGSRLKAGQCKIQSFEGYRVSENIVLLENLRFDPREEENDLGFAKKLVGLGDIYVNEAFAASHREHASIVSVPKFLPHCAGLHFASEVENLSKILENPQKPVVFVIGGAKPETKLSYLEHFARVADHVLIGGTLVQSAKCKVQSCSSKFKIVVCTDLTVDGFDISEESIKKFEEIIREAGTVVWNGPMGKYEEPEGQEGTRRIGEAIVNSKAFKVVGGGDTIAALKKFRLLDKIDYVSTGGGAMLEFLAKGTLPGIKALQ